MKTRRRYSPFKVIIYILISKALEKGIFSYNNKIIKKIWQYCFDDWVEFKVEQTMHDVDRQTRKIIHLSEERTKKSFRYSEDKKGTTPLGGEMRLSAPWKKPKK